jgi:mannose-6-phosphate isomerase-like protein (cupin superfamily)
MIDVTELLDALENAKGTIEPKPWGYEFVIDTESFLLKFIHINDGERTALHYHDQKDELNVIVGIGDENRGTIIGEDGEPLPGDRIVRIHPGVVHRAVGPLDMIEMTSHHPDDITRIADDYGRVQ